MLFGIYPPVFLFCSHSLALFLNAPLTLRLFLPTRPQRPSTLSSYNLSSVASLITPFNYTVFSSDGTDLICTDLALFSRRRTRAEHLHFSASNINLWVWNDKRDIVDGSEKRRVYIMQGGYKYSRSNLPYLPAVRRNAGWHDVLISTCKQHQEEAHEAGTSIQIQSANN